MGKVSSIKIPLCLISEFGNDVKSVQLHGFADASKVAYASKIYIRVETSVSVTSNLVTARKSCHLESQVNSTPGAFVWSHTFKMDNIGFGGSTVDNTDWLCYMLVRFPSSSKSLSSLYKTDSQKKIRSLVNKDLRMYYPVESNPSWIKPQWHKIQRSKVFWFA